MSRFFAGAALASGAFCAFKKSSQVACDSEHRSATEFTYLPPSAKHSDKTALTTNFQKYKLGQIINLTSETAIFRFLLPNEDDEFHLVPCSTLQAMFKSGGGAIDQVQRFYTPITANGEKGYFDIIVKKQKRGRMTEHLFSMEVGDMLRFRVISYKMEYIANKYKHVGLIGGGSGLTPLLQVIRANVGNPNDKTKVSLLFANPNEHRILLKGVLDDLAQKSGGKFKAHYCVDRVLSDKSYEGFTGFIDHAKVKATMPPPVEGTMMMICGPDKMLQNLAGVPPAIMSAWSSGYAMQPSCAHANNLGELGGVLAQLGYRNEQVYRF